MFQSLFQWILLTNKTSGLKINLVSLVSILVLVDLAHEFADARTRYFFTTCFNPCFSGSCSRISTKTPASMILSCFNPCFSGSCSRIPRREDRSIKQCCVSILVLVDLAHEYCLKLASSFARNCFNPCFSGSCSRM